MAHPSTPRNPHEPPSDFAATPGEAEREATTGPLQTYRGTCHCGRVEFEIDTVLDQVAVCNCSICSRRNAVMHRVTPDRFRLLKGREALTFYDFNTRTAKHWFCGTCGIYTFHQPRLAPDCYTVNVFCLEGLDRDFVAGLPVQFFDGRSFSG